MSSLLTVNFIFFVKYSKNSLRKRKQSACLCGIYFCFAYINVPSNQLLNSLAALFVPADKADLVKSQHFSYLMSAIPHKYETNG